MKNRREEIEAFFIDQNELPDRRQNIVSSSGRFKLMIRHYGTKLDCWDYSRGTVVRISDGAEMCDIKRNYGNFAFSFAIKPTKKYHPTRRLVTYVDEEWLIAGRSYMGQTIVNLDMGTLYESPGNQYDPCAFCWSDHKLSPDGNTLMVDGCHWACPYEYRFYDFTDPSKGWPELEISPDKYLEADGRQPPIWKKDGTFECYEVREMYKPLNKEWDYITEEELGGISDEQSDDKSNFENVVVVRTVLRRNGNKMEVIEKWVSEDEQKRRDENEEANRKHNEFVKNFKASDGIYLTMNKYIARHFLPADYGDWWGWREDEKTINKYFSLGGKRFEMRRGLETGWITVEYYEGKEKRKIEFECSEKGMVDALKLIGKQFSLIKRLLHRLKEKCKWRKS